MLFARARPLLPRTVQRRPWNPERTLLVVLLLLTCPVANLGKAAALVAPGPIQDLEPCEGPDGAEEVAAVGTATRAEPARHRTRWPPIPGDFRQVRQTQVFRLPSAVRGSALGAALRTTPQRC